MNNEEDISARKIKLCIEEVQGRSCLTDFHGMDLTRDRKAGKDMIQKLYTQIEAQCDVRTTGGFVVRLFCFGFAKRPDHQVKRNCYAQTSQVRKLRNTMIAIMTAEASSCPLRELVKKLNTETINKEILKQCSLIFPLKDTVCIRKVKVIKKPKFDITKLMEMHGEGDDDDYGADMLGPEGEDAQNTLTADVAAAAEEE